MGERPRMASVFRVFGALALGVAAFTLAIGLGGCVTRFDTSREVLAPLHAQGRFDEAARLLDDPETKADYGEKNRLLWWLERGAVASALDQHEVTLDTLEKAESYMEVHREPTGSDEFARWLLNDTAAPYYGEPYEDLYVNVLKLLAQLERGEVQGGATVEARRMAGKADVLRDRYVRTDAALRERSRAESRSSGSQSSGDAFSAATSSASTRFSSSSGVAGDFIETTLGTYLTAATFMASGDRDLQEVAGRRLESAIRLQGSLVGPVDPSKFETLGTRRLADGNVLIVGLSGRGPTKVPERIGPIPIYTWPVYFELPQLVGGSAEVGSVRVLVESPAGGTATTTGLDFVEDMRSVATENHRRQLPQIYARTYLRSSIKAAAAAIGTEVARSQARSGDTRDLVTIGGIIAGLALVMGTEKADLRSWTFLPGRADAGFITLPPGEHAVRLEFLGRGGGVLYTSPPRTVRVSSDQLTTVVERYWR
jgi:hypothetical protein